MTSAVDVEASWESVEEHALLEFVRKRDWQVTVVGLLESEGVVTHVSVDGPYRIGRSP